MFRRAKPYVYKVKIYGLWSYRVNLALFMGKLSRKISIFLHINKKRCNFAPVQWNEGLDKEFPHFYLNNSYDR